MPCNGGLVSQSRLNIPISLGAQATRSRLSSGHDSDLSLEDGRVWAGLAAPHHPWHLPGARLPESVRSSKQGHKSQYADKIWSGPDEDLLEYYELTNRRYEDFRSDSDYQEELEPPRAEAMVEVLEAEVKVGPSLGRVLGE